MERIGTVSEIASLWSRVLLKAKTALNDQNVYEAFFASSYIDHLEGGTAFIVVNSRLAASLLEAKYKNLLESAMREASGTNFELKFITEDEIKEEPVVEEKKANFFKDASLNPNFNFQNFVVGPSNREAYQASLMVARSPGKLYNPLLIFGGSGLGKTHLLQAIGNSLKDSYPNLRVLYITAADFVDEYVSYVRGQKDGETLSSFFKNSIDVFLVDDIQFLVGKSGTMEMFFVIFSALYAQGKQIVITSDQHPNQLDGLDERLKTRFIAGLTLDVKAPDLLTSEEILRARITADGLDVNDFDPEVITFLAKRFSSSIRELEEALNRLLFYTINIRPSKHIDLSLASEAIQGLIRVQDDESKLSDTKIIATVADYYSLTPSQITGKIRTSQIAMARHIAMYLMRTLLDDPFQKIGKALGGKDHATVMNGVQKVENALKNDPEMQTAIRELTAKLKK